MRLSGLRLLRPRAACISGWRDLFSSGYKDRGVLIGKVYDHLSSEPAQAQAAKLTSGPLGPRRILGAILTSKEGLEEG